MHTVQDSWQTITAVWMLFVCLAIVVTDCAIISSLTLNCHHEETEYFFMMLSSSHRRRRSPYYFLTSDPSGQKDHNLDSRSCMKTAVTNECTSLISFVIFFFDFRLQPVVQQLDRTRKKDSLLFCLVYVRACYRDAQMHSQSHDLFLSSRQLTRICIIITFSLFYSVQQVCCFVPGRETIVIDRSELTFADRWSRFLLLLYFFFCFETKRCPTDHIYGCMSAY